MAPLRLVFGILGALFVSGAAFAQAPGTGPSTSCGKENGWGVVDGLCLPTVENPVEACSPTSLKNSVTVHGYTFRSFLSKDHGSCLKVIHAGKVVLGRTIDSWSGYVLGQPASKEEGTEITAIPDGADITGNGRPDMIVSFSSGGAHCCSFHYVFELEPRFKRLITIQDTDDELAHFELFPDGKYYYLLEDYTFANWVSCTFCSPTTHVILRIVDDGKDSTLRLAWDKMAKPAPSSEQWRLKVKEVRSLIQSPNPQFDPDAALWSEVLDLIFSGHSELAWRFVTEAAPKGTERTDLGSFCSILKGDPFWQQIEPMLKGTPDKCASAKRRSL